MRFSGFLSIARLGGGLRRLPNSPEIRRLDEFEIGNT
jgi:hypothetical protein